MSLSLVDHIIFRISVATKKSPIAIFRTSYSETERLDAIFVAPVKSQTRIKKEPHNLIGIYDQDSDAPDFNEVRIALNKELLVPAVYK